MINHIQLTPPAKMLRATALNVRQFLRLRKVYSDCATSTDRAVHEAADAVLRLECRAEPVIVALANLAASFEAKHPETETDRAERYVAECWREYAPPPSGVVYKS